MLVRLNENIFPRVLEREAVFIGLLDENNQAKMRRKPFFCWMVCWVERILERVGLKTFLVGWKEFWNVLD